MKAGLAFALVVPALAAAAAIGIYSGTYNVGADEPHWPFTADLLTIVRERSIDARAKGVAVPDLRGEKRIAEGAGQYAEMCESCHLAPGVANTEVREGLNPKPPQLWRQRVEPGHAFWVVKHGIKATGMPAWGPTHDDQTLWSIVAFLEKLPELSAEDYRRLVAQAPAHEQMSQADRH